MAGASEIDAALCDRAVLFLDVDGVLLPVPRFSFGGGELNEDCVRRLLRIVDALGGRDKVSFILSSTWRNFPEMVERLNKFFEKAAGDALPKISGGTPSSTVIASTVTYYADDPSEQRLVQSRVDEIERWLHTHLRDHPEAIAGRWLAIDDMKLDVDGRMAGHFLHTDTETGMTDGDVARALEIIATFPSQEEAVANAQRALVDPALKDEEIAILEVLRTRLEARVAALEAELAAAKEEVTSLSVLRRDHERELKDNAIRMEDMSYRLALHEFTKRNAVVEAAVKLAATKTGKERKELDDRIRSLVNMMRSRKELEKKIRAEAKRQHTGKQPSVVSA